MISILSHNILSPLGVTTSENFDAVMSGRSGIRQWHDCRGIHEDFAASIFPDGFFANIHEEGLSRFESLALCSARKALADAGIDKALGQTVFVLSTTKGNVEWLGDGVHSLERVLPSSSAKIIANRLGIETPPIVADNACISGLSAIILACRLLEMGCYDNAVVCGAEVQSKFIISGFQSLKATSRQPCRPFDIERTGLNLGEASATIVLSNKPGNQALWKILRGSVRNDAFHISAPAKDGVGAYEALAQCSCGVSIEDFAFVNAHGTATLFNDQMEAIAIDRAGLRAVPVNGYKGYYGHTMGACGVLETVLSMYALDKDVLLPTKGFEELGVSKNIDVVSCARKTSKKSFLKMLSGFGGGNAAILVSKNHDDASAPQPVRPATTITHKVRITEKTVDVDGSRIATQSVGKSLLTELYKRFVGDYPRFYKMDILCRLGFIATELLLRAESAERFKERSDRAIILIGNSGSIVADKNYYQSISDSDDYFPSPERFVYTLPNIVTGEIAIRNHYRGETGFYYVGKKDYGCINQIISSSFSDPATQSVIGGWINSDSEDRFDADIYIKEKVYA